MKITKKIRIDGKEYEIDEISNPVLSRIFNAYIDEREEFIFSFLFENKKKSCKFSNGHEDYSYNEYVPEYPSGGYYKKEHVDECDCKINFKHVDHNETIDIQGINRKEHEDECRGYIDGEKYVLKDGNFFKHSDYGIPYTDNHTDTYKHVKKIR